MRDEETRLLFQTLSQILANQYDIKKHLGLNFENMVGMTKIQ